MVNDLVDSVYRTESRRVLATLIRLLGDFDLAEEALHDAFIAAVEQWPRDGVPGNPRAWLVSAGRFRAIDTMRRRARARPRWPSSPMLADRAAMPAADADEDGRRGRPAASDLHLLPPGAASEARVALTLREVCGLTTEEIARAFLTPPPTLAQRIVRAKAKIRDARDPVSKCPSRESCRSGSTRVLHVVYLVFNEGYSASSGESLTRTSCRAKRSGSAACSSSSCPSPRRWACWR